MRFDPVSEGIIGAALEVHRELGPGLLESTDAACLRYELTRRKLPFESEKSVPVRYKDVQIDCSYRLDLLVASTVVVEIKAIQRIERVHEAQILSYLKLTGCPIGLLINFNVALLKNGLRRLVRGFEEVDPSRFSRSSR
jgi:GxxExxY protein